MSLLDPTLIFSACAQPATLNGEETYAFCIQPRMITFMGDVVPNYIIGQDSYAGSIICYPLYSSSAAPKSIKLRTSSSVIRIGINTFTNPDPWVEATPILDSNGTEVIGYEPIEFTVSRDDTLTIGYNPNLLWKTSVSDLPSTAWSPPILYADPSLFVEAPAPSVDSRPLIDALKKLLLAELRADDGWDRYADFLLSEMDMSFLRFGATQGVPYDFQVQGWVEKILTGASSKDYPIGVEDEGSTIVYPNPACPARLDFGTVDVLFGPMVSHVDIDLGNGEVNTVTFPMDATSETPRTAPIPVTISGAGSFKAHLLTEEGAPTIDEYPLFRLAELPEYANPVAIQQYRIENFELLDRNNPPITPAKLFAQIRALGDFRFYVAFKTVNGYGSRTAFYKDYATVLSQEELRDARSASYWNLVFGSRLPLDALRDIIGSGAAASDIIGYDKGFLVSRTSIIETPLYLLQGSDTPYLSTSLYVDASPTEIEIDQRGDATQKLHIRSDGGFTTDASEAIMQDYKDMLLGWKDASGEIILLTNPVNYLRKNSTGITKNYSMLSYPAGPIESIDVFIEALESQLKSRYGAKGYQQRIDALTAVLKAATPAWADSSVNFVYPQVESEVELYDEWVGNKQEILVNGKTPNTAPVDGVEVLIEQRGTAQTIRIVTRPAAIDYSVKEE